MQDLRLICLNIAIIKENFIINIGMNKKEKIGRSFRFDTRNNFETIKNGFYNNWCKKKKFWFKINYATTGSVFQFLLLWKLHSLRSVIFTPSLAGAKIQARQISGSRYSGEEYEKKEGICISLVLVLLLICALILLILFTQHQSVYSKQITGSNYLSNRTIPAISIDKNIPVNTITIGDIIYNDTHYQLRCYEINPDKNKKGVY